jgi:TM2 domain-containing membrane protein YozV
MAEDNKQFEVVPAMVLNWLVPGAGHWYLGDRVRAVIYFISITLTFWIGILIGGAQSTVNIQTNTAWFFAQIFTGGYTIFSLLLGHLPGAMPSYSKTLDLATIYTGVAGLLNIYVIFDAMSRAVPAEKQESQK